MQERLQHEERRLEVREEADIQRVLSTPEGRRLYYRLTFLLAGLEEASFSESAPRMAFMEGRRSVALTLRDEAQTVCPHLWMRMLEERLSDASENEARQRQVLTTHTENDP